MPEPPSDPPTAGSTPEPPTSPPPSGSGERRGLWQRVFGGLGDKKAEVLLALIGLPVALIGAITGLVLAFGGNDHSDSQNASAPVTSPTGAPTTQPTTASPADVPV